MGEFVKVIVTLLFIVGVFAGAVLAVFAMSGEEAAGHAVCGGLCAVLVFLIVILVLCT